MQPRLHQYHVVKAPYPETAPETEIALTFLSGARLTECGYNYNPPGNMIVHSGYNSFFALNRVERFSGKEAERDRQESHEKAVKYAEMCEKLKTMDVDEKEVRRKQEANVKKAKEVIAQIKAIEKARKMKKKITSVEEIVADFREKYGRGDYGENGSTKAL